MEEASSFTSLFLIVRKPNRRSLSIISIIFVRNLASVFFVSGNCYKHIYIISHFPNDGFKVLGNCFNQTLPKHLKRSSQPLSQFLRFQRFFSALFHPNSRIGNEFGFFSVGFGSGSFSVSRTMRGRRQSKYPSEDLGQISGADSMRKMNVSPEKDTWLNQDKENGRGIGGDDGGMGQSAGGELGFDKIEKGVSILEISDGIGKSGKRSAGKSFGETSETFVGLGGEEKQEVEKERLSGLDESGWCLEIGNIGWKVKKARGWIKLDIDHSVSAGLVQECSKNQAIRDKEKGKVIEDDLVCYGVGEEKLDMNGKHHKSSGLTLEDERGNRKVTGESTQGSVVVEDLEDDLILNENTDIKEIVDTMLLLANDYRATPSKQFENTLPAERENLRRSRYKESARRSARTHALYQPEEEQKYVSVEVEDKEDIEDCAGPFSIAIKMIEDRKKRILQGTSSNLDKCKCESIMWFPKPRSDNVKHLVPSLLDLCSVHLAKYTDAIVSLEGVPDFLRNRLSQFLIDSHSMKTHIFKLFLHGSPVDIRLKNCSWLPEEEFSNLFQGFDASNLTVCFHYF